jgi:hypothetical protein
MTVIVPGMTMDGQRIPCRPMSESESLHKRWRRRDMENLIELQNKFPTWNEETQSYVLNFFGRVTVASVKNFQIIHEEDRTSACGYMLLVSRATVRASAVAPPPAPDAHSGVHCPAIRPRHR